SLLRERTASSYCSVLGSFRVPRRTFGTGPSWQKDSVEESVQNIRSERSQAHRDRRGYHNLLVGSPRVRVLVSKRPIRRPNLPKPRPANSRTPFLSLRRRLLQLHTIPNLLPGNRRHLR